MAENVRPPVAIRIVRPYDTEDQLLEHELDTVGKTSVVLIGAHPRPTGVILRFEVTLATGATVLRGEGRVLAHKENAFRGQPGLTLRFTRLDPKSKGVVDRATAMREARQAEGGGTPSRPAPRPEGPIADALTAATPSPSATAPLPANVAASSAEQEAAVASARASAREKANAQARANARRTGGTIPPTGKTMALTPPPLPVMAGAAPESDAVTSVPGEVRELPAGGGTPSSPVGARTAEPAAVDHAVSEPATAEESSAEQSSAEPRASVPTQTSPTISAPPLRSGRAGASSRRAPAESLAEITANAAAAAASLVSNASSTAPRAAAASPIEAPPDRPDLLARLRLRASKLDPERVQEILASRR